MANIDPYIKEIQNAQYGEEVRGSIINALVKVNDDNESYQELKDEVIKARDTIVDSVLEYKQSIEIGKEEKEALESTISTASTSKNALDESVKTASTSKNALDESVKIASTSKNALDESVKTASGTIELSNSSKNALDESVKTANSAKEEMNLAEAAATKTKQNLDSSVESANASKKELDASTESANKIKQNLDGLVTNANTSKENLEKVIGTSEQSKLDLNASIDIATGAKKELDAASGVVDESVKEAVKAKTNLDNSITSANKANGTLTDTITLSNTVRKNLDDSIANAISEKESVEAVIKSAGQAQKDLSSVMSEATTTKGNLDNAVKTANQALLSLDSENISAASNIEELRSENFNSQEILSGVADLRAYLGLTDDDILGVQVDYKNKSFKRIAGAVNLTKGADFDRFSMFGGRRRCNVADDGTIVAWYGDTDYKEDGTMGQVMVYQPKFYYLVCPVVYDPIETGIGYHLRKANYYVSEKPRAGFRLHPAFYDVNGHEIDYFLTSAYEGSIWDVDGGEDGTGAYLIKDEQVMNLATDKFCSIAGVKPASGQQQVLTRPNIEALAKNRGANWHGDLIKQVSAEQLLMIIEMGMMNLQTAIAQGIVSIPDNGAYNCASNTGSTFDIGNGTGQAAETTNVKGDASTIETANGKTAICYRGKENFWGNIWKFVYGINIWGNGKMGGGQPYICKDFNFMESKNADNYVGAGFTITNKLGYISAMGYSTSCDWLFIASETDGNSSLPVGDYHWITANLNGYRIAPLGGYWHSGAGAGAFCWTLPYGVGYRSRHFGGRLVYIPTRDSAEYTAAITSWKEQMKKV